MNFSLPKSTAGRLALLVIVVGAILRLYRIEDTLMFQGDQGRDAMVADRILHGDAVLIGPVTSVGNMYLGPLYYYFMAPFLALTYPNPVGPAIGVALLNILLLYLVYRGCLRWFNERVALVSTLLLATNVIAVELSRYSWNPNIAPFLAFTTFAASLLALRREDYRWLVVAGLSFGLLTQSHYMALLMGGVPLAAFLYALWQKKTQQAKVLSYGLNALAVYALTWLPLVVFDVKHNGIIRSGFSAYFGEQATKTPLVMKVIRSIKEVQGRSFRILAQLNQSPNGVIDRVVVYGSILLASYFGLLKKTVQFKKPKVWLLIVWLLTGIVGTAVYPDTIHDHYLAYLLPGVAIFFGLLLDRLWQAHLVGKAVGVVVIGLYLMVNIPPTPAFNEGGPPAKQFERFSQHILPQIPEGKYNIALISESKDWRGFNYRYFLSVSDHPPANVEDYDTLDSLVIIDELRVDDPLSFGTYEIQTPGLTNITQQFDISGGPRIYIVE